MTIKVQGHRGSRGTHRENTLPAVNEAIEALATCIEVDLQVTADGEIVVYHDYVTEPTLLTYSDGTPLKERKLIRACTLAELKELDYGFLDHPYFPQQKGCPGTMIPTLEELFALLGGHNDPWGKTLSINLELKRDPAHPDWSIDPEPFARKVSGLTRHYGFEPRVYYSSFDPEILEALRREDPSATLGYILQAEDFIRLFPSLIERARTLGVSIISPRYTALSQERVHILQNVDFRVVPWTVNDPKAWQQLMDMGVDEIITDYPREHVNFNKRGENG